VRGAKEGAQGGREHFVLQDVLHEKKMMIPIPHPHKTHTSSPFLWDSSGTMGGREGGGEESDERHVEQLTLTEALARNISRPRMALSNVLFPVKYENSTLDKGPFHG